MNERDLVRQAIAARERAYTPYSGFMVGAALLAESGKVYLGCNIENAAYTPTICAERTAFSKAVSEGERSFTMIAIAGWAKEARASKGKPISGIEAGSRTKQGADCVQLQAGAYPCGVCRQVMMEFCKPESFRVIVAISEDNYRVHSLEQLLPHGFGPADLAPQI